MKFIKNLFSLFDRISYERERRFCDKARNFAEEKYSGFPKIFNVYKAGSFFTVNLQTVVYEKDGKTNSFTMETNIHTDNGIKICVHVMEVFDTSDGTEEYHSDYTGGAMYFVPAHTSFYTKEFTTITDACNWCTEVDMATKAIACAAYLLGRENEMISSADMDKIIADRKQREKERIQQQYMQEIENERREIEIQRKKEEQRKEYEKKFKIGKIKIFYSAKLFGFIDMNRKDIFFHFSDVVNENDQQKILKNTKVKFIPVNTKKGLKATKIKIL